MAMANPPPKPVRILTILKEAAILPKKNPGLILSVFLISLLTTYLYFAALQLSTFSILTDLANKSASFITADPTNPAYYQLLAALQKDIKELTSIEVIFIIIGVIISYVVRTVTTYALAVTHVGKLLTLKELLCSVKRILKGPIITQFLVSLLIAGYIVLLIAVLFLFWYISNDSLFLLTLVGLLAIAALVWYLYLIALCYLSITVSIVEQGSYGVGAIARAAELIKGSKWQGIAIIIISTVVATPIAAGYSLASVSIIHLSIWGQLVLGSVYILVIQVLSLFILAAFVVFYYECKRSHGEGTPDMISNFVNYTSLPTADADVV